MVALRTTLEEFESFINLPQNLDKRFELIGGEIFEVPSNPYSSQIAALMIAALLWYLKQHDLGHVTGEGGGYMVAGERYAPDVAFISKKRQPHLVREGYNPEAPDLAVEVMSDITPKILRKVGNYLAAGTTVWVVYPDSQTVEIYAPAQPVKILGIHDTLDGGSLFPGFQLPVKEVFPQG